MNPDAGLLLQGAMGFKSCAAELLKNRACSGAASVGTVTVVSGFQRGLDKLHAMLRKAFAAEASFSSL